MHQWPLLHQPRLQPTPHQCQKVPVFLVTKVDWASLGLPAVVLLYPHQRQVHFNFWKKQRRISETLQDENDQGLGGAPARTLSIIGPKSWVLKLSFLA